MTIRAAQNINPTIAASLMPVIRRMAIEPCSHPREDRKTWGGETTCNRCGLSFGQVSEQYFTSESGR